MRWTGCDLFRAGEHLMSDLIDRLRMYDGTAFANSLCEQAADRIAELERQLRIAAGMLSTIPPWNDKHPEEALAFIERASAERGPVHD
jgi:hypothetical protein